jgi:hypothetical protein
MYKEDGGGVIIDSDSRKQVGASYYNTLKKIVRDNDFVVDSEGKAVLNEAGEKIFAGKKGTESDSINKLQDRLLKLKPGEESNLLTEVKNKMAINIGLKKTTEDTNQKSTSIAPNNTENDTEVRVVYNGESIIVNEESTKLFKDNGVDINTLPKDNVTNKNKTTTTTDTNKTNTSNEVSNIDESKTETVAKLIREKAISEEKIRPGGDAGQGEFQSISAVKSILPKKMSGKEIKERYAIAFPLNNFTIYYPSK